ncbi:class I SAM-dependent methyltransferase [Legionella clemsonensis]|uniref:Methyltransferase domain-containing protein n=1 Tax=Legionella clemsonensis TaxID=1867846 RepID=A0A222P4S4_9GAMM|nr:class I SAM-dependent methyltransferase [Legionella clemsonensis]ASQ46785.1 hypothetical protein clem_11195 [Legionella clemsonensis]
MKLFAKLLEATLLPERKDGFLFPFPQSFLFYDVKIDHPNQFLIHGEPVRKLRLLYQSQNQHNPLLPSPAACYIHYEHGKKEVRSIDPDKVQEVLKSFRKYSGNSIQTFSRMNEDQLNWQENSMRCVYQQQTKDPEVFYTELHEKIITGIEMIAARESLQRLNIVDGGCGDGKLLKKIEGRFSGNITFKMKLLGFDFNQENVAACRQNYAGQCNFIEGDLLQIQRLIQDSKAKGWINPDWPILLTLSGSLTRLVLKNGFDASHVLMQTSASQVNYLVGGGVGEPLTTSWMLKQVGYKSNPIPVSEGHHFFSYQQQQRLDFLAAKLARLQKTNRLELALCPNPVEALLAMQPYLQHDSSIDLSFLPLTKELIEALTKVLELRPTLKLIFWHPQQEAVKQFLEHFFLKAEVTVKILKQDATLLSSHRFYTLLKGANPTDFIDYETIYQFILGYFDKALSMERINYEKCEMVLMHKIIKSITEPNTIVLKETDDDRPRVLVITKSAEDEELIKNYFFNFIASCEKEIMANNLRMLPLVIFWYQKGFNLGSPFGDYDVQEVNRFIPEINLYAYLAKHHTKKFDNKAMEMLAKWTIMTKTKPDSEARKAGMAELELLWPTESNTSSLGYTG